MSEKSKFNCPYCNSSLKIGLDGEEILINRVSKSSELKELENGKEKEEIKPTEEKPPEEKPAEVVEKNKSEQGFFKKLGSILSDEE